MTGIHLRVVYRSCVTGTMLYHVYLTWIIPSTELLNKFCVSPEPVCRLFHYLALSLDPSTHDHN